MYIEHEEVGKSDGETRSNYRENIGSSFCRFVDYALRWKNLRIENGKRRRLNGASNFERVAEELSKEEEYAMNNAKDLDTILPENVQIVKNLTCEEKSIDGSVISSLEKSEDNLFDKNHDNMELMDPEEKDESDSFEDEEEEEEEEEEGNRRRIFRKKFRSIFFRKRGLEKNNNPTIDSANVIIKNVDKKPMKLRKKRAISFADTLLSLFVVGPLTIGQWRGIWNMMDIYNEFFPEWTCFIVGSGLHVLFAIGRDGLHSRFVENLRSRGKSGRVVYDLVRLSYIYIFCVACNAHWRGGWQIFDDFIGSNTWVVIFFTILLTAGLVFLRSIRNLLAPPFIVIIDRPDRVFRFPTRYSVNTRDWSLYILDCAFSVLVVGSLVVFVWRGVWVLFELHLFPENREYSAIGSLIIGYIIVAVTFCLQPLMRYTCARLEGLARLLAADAFLLLSFLGTVNVWRGIWSILDLWLLPDDLELSCWITHVGCFVFLVLLNCSNSILVRGVYIDAEEEEGRCVVFPCHYLRLFFKIERQKKEARRQNLVAASKDAQSRNDANAKEMENETLLNCANTLPTIITANPESLV